MKAPVQPPKLREDQALSSLIRAEADRQPDSQLGLRVGQRINEKIGALTQGRSFFSFAPGRRWATIAVGLSMLVGISATAAYTIRWLLPPEPVKVAPPQKKGYHKPSRPPTEKPLAELLQIEPVLVPAPKAPRSQQIAAVEEAPPAELPSVPSLLSAQLALYQQAQQAAASGELTLALALLAQMDQRYPSHPLQAELAMSRADWLYQAGRYVEAGAHIDGLLGRPLLRGKKAQFLRMRGDILLHQGKNQQAADAFRRALGLGLNEAQAEAARRGLQKSDSR